MVRAITMIIDRIQDQNRIQTGGMILMIDLNERIALDHIAMVILIIKETTVMGTLNMIIIMHKAAG